MLADGEDEAGGALPPKLRFLAGGGEATRLILTRDWTGHWLGPPQDWPEALKVSLSLVLNSPESMILSWGREQLTFFFNETYFPLLGPRLPWAMGAPFTEVWAEAWDQAKPIIDEAFAGRSRHFDDLPWKLGEDRGQRDTWWSFSYSRVFDGEGETSGLFIFANETTSRVLADAAVRDSQAKLRTQMERQGSLLLLDDRLREADNPAALSYTASELLGQTLGVARVGYGEIDADAGAIAVERNWSAPGVADVAGLHHFQDYGSYIDDLRRGLAVANADVANDPRTAARIASFRALGIAAHLDVPVVEQGVAVAQIFVHSAEPRVWLDEDIVLVRDFAERTRAAIARRQAEQDLRASEARLEVRVTERTAELEFAHEQLRQSQKMEAVGQLTGGLAHDFNNLLAGISGSLELMSTRLAQGRVRDVEKYLTAPQGAARRAAALTHRLLAFSRRQTLDPKPTDVNRLVANMGELIRRTVGPAIKVEVVGASGLWTALVDPPQLENALLNLCINARDAMPHGGRITIETANKWIDHASARQHDMPEGQFLSICVTDTGTGMAPDVAAKAFDPFFTTKP